MNSSRPFPMRMMSEFGISGYTVVLILIWVAIAKAKNGIDGVKRTGLSCAVLGMGGGALFGYTPELTTCAGIGAMIWMSATGFPFLWGGTKKEKKK